MMCEKLAGIKAGIAENESELTKQLSDGTLTAAGKVALDTYRYTLYLEKRDHKFFGHGGAGCPEA